MSPNPDKLAWNETIVVVGPHCWGEGPKLRVALGRARINCPSWWAHEGGMPYNAYVVTKDFKVDGMGTLTAERVTRFREARVKDGRRTTRDTRRGDVLTGD